MSVEYRAVAGFGFRITEAEVNALDDDTRDAFFDDDATVPVNTWQKNCEYYFGTTCGEAEFGTIREIDPTIKTIEEVVARFYEFFPARKYEVPRLYIVNSIT